VLNSWKFGLNEITRVTKYLIKQDIIPDIRGSILGKVGSKNEILLMPDK
jgi:hypothetical protein